MNERLSAGRGGIGALLPAIFCPFRRAGLFLCLCAGLGDDGCRHWRSRGGRDLAADLPGGSHV